MGATPIDSASLDRERKTFPEALNPPVKKPKSSFFQGIWSLDTALSVISIAYAFVAFIIYTRYIKSHAVYVYKDSFFQTSVQTPSYIRYIFISELVLCPLLIFLPLRRLFFDPSRAKADLIVRLMFLWKTVVSAFGLLFLSQIFRAGIP